MGTYQDLGYFAGNRLAVLKPKKGLSLYQADANSELTPLGMDDPNLVRDAVSYYQAASYLLKHNLYRRP